MNEAKFNEITKKVRFRQFKLWYGKLSSVIKYNIYNILNKLHIIDKYRYEDSGTYFIAQYPKAVQINTHHFNAKVCSRLFEDIYIDTEYFYKKRKDGSKKILLTIKDTNMGTYYLNSHLEDINVMIGKKNFPLENNFFPVVKEYAPVHSVNHQSGNSYTTVEYNFSPLFNLRTRNVVSSKDINSDEIKEAFRKSCNVLRTLLENKTLNDFRIGVGINDSM